MNVLTIVSLQYNMQPYTALFQNHKLVLHGCPWHDEDDCVDIADFEKGARVFADKVDMIDLDAQSSVEYFDNGMLDEEKLKRALVLLELGRS